MTEPYHHDIPVELVKHVTAICGEKGVAWLKRLPETIAELEEIWNVKVGEPFVKGEFNFVATATSETGIDAVIKISPPYERIEIFAEASFLKIRSGNGCVIVLAEDRDRLAILIERARPGDSMDVHFSSEPFACVEPAIEVLKSILLPPDASADVQYLDDWVDRLRRRFRETEFPWNYGEKALAIFEKLSAQRDRIFYIHGDFHPANIVTAGRSAYLAIDPKGLVGHIGYDISVFLNNLHWWQKGKPDIQHNLFAAAEKFATEFDLDVRTIREAAFAGMVIGAWWNCEDMPEHYDNEVVLVDIWEV